MTLSKFELEYDHEHDPTFWFRLWDGVGDEWECEKKVFKREGEYYTFEDIADGDVAYTQRWVTENGQRVNKLFEYTIRNVEVVLEEEHGEYAELLERHRELENRLADAGKEYLKKHLQGLMKSFDLKGISWTQYTPYFNDGEPCVFGVHDFWGFNNEDDWANFQDNNMWPEDCNAWSIPVNAPPERMMEQYFGDHVEVRFDGENFTEREYRHD